jgi:hypothetical protein
MAEIHPESAQMTYSPGGRTLDDPEIEMPAVFVELD